MSEEEKVGADIALEIGGQKVNVKNVKSLNTLATIATLIMVSLIAYGGWLHVQSQDKHIGVLQDTFKEIASGQREQNCLIAIPEAQRENKADFCKRITR